MGSSSLSVQYGAVMQVIDLILLCGVLWTFRSRPFPNFYTLGINEMNVIFIRNLHLYRILGQTETMITQMSMPGA
jgi:ABC-type uncharacterized transport system fused permease/ATPase subunit